jgi:CBS domain-containing protein
MRKLVPDVIQGRVPLTLPPEATVAEACRRMAADQVGAVVVAGPGQALRGIFTARDAVWRVIGAGLDPRVTPLGQVMTANPASLPPDATAVDALDRMRDGGFRHVVVADAGRVVGIVSRRDFSGHEIDRTGG